MILVPKGIGATGRLCLPPAKRRSGTLASADITWRSFRQAVVKSHDAAVLKKLVYCGHVDTTS
eukprot:6198334-Pleurochrysis_carterae.AAC.1